MFNVLAAAWALFLGMALLMVGNGMQGTLLGVRGEIEGFSTLEMSFVMSAYFAGFLGGSKLAPEMIRRVGHVRVFAALASFISAILILYPAITQPWAWVLLRVLIGFCFSGVYVTAESWLNNSVTNERRGQALSLYMIVQMSGVLAAQALLVTGDPSGFVLFIIPSVLVSMSFAPILLSATPTPAFETTKPMSLLRLYQSSPLGCVGIFLVGGVYSAQFGMASVYASQIGFSVREVAIFVGAIYLGGLILQFPIGWLSDRLDRRLMILGVAALGGVVCILGLLPDPSLALLCVAAFVLGGMANPLYPLLIAYTNDYLDYEDMSAASGGLIFIFGLGAIAGPLAIGVLIGWLGPMGFWVFLGVLMLALAAYAGYRMTRRASPDRDEYGQYIPITPTTHAVTLDAAQEWLQEQAEEEEEQSATADGTDDTDTRAAG
ncbi:Predicted arabinose efflux permease, MFS family [Palleronia salina]|uniref:Predicted arabinose efflux permease, MFS family n=1 Tax=Palleronia salina TaxID=313368 RepID=A0A1M6A6N6_9RHOB|nr:MFS transporter [Palleronia salina]SHI32105.1 Predicted arabinose efflux permease, MFS family [Palleronia salina]